MLKRRLLEASGSEEQQVPNKIPSESKYFQSFQQQFLQIQMDLNTKLKPITFKEPVKYIYNPLEYAFEVNKMYIEKFCNASKKVIFVGMNPGPHGMCQTGVPFGDVTMVRDWLGITGPVRKPEGECPKRPILGFDCKTSEPSGKRFWNVFKNLCATPDVFFRDCFVYNYCPLAMMSESGRNLTPRDIKDHHQLEIICDEFYGKILQLLRPEIVIAVGEYIEKRTTAVLKKESREIKLLRLPHPSPRSLNNQNWPEKAEEFLKTHNILRFFQET